MKTASLIGRLKALLRGAKCKKPCASQLVYFSGRMVNPSSDLPALIVFKSYGKLHLSDVVYLNHMIQNVVKKIPIRTEALVNKTLFCSSSLV